MKRTLVTALVAVAAVAAAGIAYAAIPSGNGVISACKTKDGAVKLIDKEAGQGCNSSQQLVEWNQQGPPGPTGQEGPAGVAGEDGFSGYGVVTQAGAVAGGGTGLVVATCSAGKKVLGGGWWANPQTHVLVARSRPNGTATAWEVSVLNEHPTVAITFNVYAICALASEAS